MKLFDVYPLYDIEPVRGEGARVFDAAGTSYLDFYGGHAVISIGHGQPHYVSMISAQLQRLGFYSNSIVNSLQKELADKLGALSGLDEYQLFLISTGAEAIENALKLASFHNGRSKVVAFKKAFHGRTSAAVNITPDTKIVAPINEGFVKEFHEMNDFATVEATVLRGDVCAVIVEGIQGVGGIHAPSAEFLQSIQKLCQITDTVLILDEVQSGYGRSGKFFAFQHTGDDSTLLSDRVQPDIVTMAKGMGNGFPIGGILIHPKFQSRYGMLGTTFGGSHLACAAGIAVLDVLQSDNLIENAATVGAYLFEQMQSLPSVKEVRGRGLMIGVEFDFPVADMRKRLAFEQYVFVGSSSEANTVRLLPPLCINKGDVDELTWKMRKVLA